jgi:hypothetical protein
MALRGRRLFGAASSGIFELPDGTKIPVDVNLLGATQEADVGTVEEGVIPFDPKNFTAWYAAIVEGFYGNFHNVGHDMFGWLTTNSNPPHNGIMGFVPTACRDHVFFRWHRLIDTLCSAWQDTQPSHDFSADAPPVTIRKSLPDEPAGQSPDIILCLAKDLVPWDRWDEFGAYAFGGDANWDRSFASGSFPSGPNLPTPFTTTGELLTEMRRRVITIETGAEPPAQRGEAPHEIEYLDQDEFFYFLRLENTSTQAQDVTVRVFLVPIEPKDLTEDRVAWIEMD